MQVFFSAAEIGSQKRIPGDNGNDTEKPLMDCDRSPVFTLWEFRFDCSLDFLAEASVEFCCQAISIQEQWNSQPDTCHSKLWDTPRFLVRSARTK